MNFKKTQFTAASIILAALNLYVLYINLFEGFGPLYSTEGNVIMVSVVLLIVNAVAIPIWLTSFYFRK